ncbi:hypothetical protein Syun_023430 [Stephania yunnanensis]|uniref:Uncharacterized protein n=1 Tax=Stephania yunnanensis TaxID=152371 RepID=A0AAP0F9M6_9MAGN
MREKRKKKKKDRDSDREVRGRREEMAERLRLTVGIKRRHGRPAADEQWLADELQQLREAGTVVDGGPAGGDSYKEAAAV